MPETLLTAPPEETTGAANTATGQSATAVADPKPTPSWRDPLPPELKDHKSLSRYTDLSSFAKGFVEMEKYQGRSVAFPGETATPQERAAFERRSTSGAACPTRPTGTPSRCRRASRLTRRDWASGSPVPPAGPHPGSGRGSDRDYFGSATGNPRSRTTSCGPTGTRTDPRVGRRFRSQPRRREPRHQARSAAKKSSNYWSRAGLNNHPVMVKFWHRLGQGLPGRRRDPVGPARGADGTGGCEAAHCGDPRRPGAPVSQG